MKAFRGNNSLPQSGHYSAALLGLLRRPNAVWSKRSVVLATIVAVLIFSAGHAKAQSAAQGAKPAAMPTGNAENGKKLFTKYGCYQCHGFQGQGSQGTGARIAPDPTPLQVFISYVRKPTGEMPPYTAKVVSDQELADIHAFLRSLSRPPDVKTIPLLQ
jgi:mono/diheme cytochrome c family protein